MTQRTLDLDHRAVEALELQAREPARAPGVLHRCLRALVHARLRELREGALVLVERGQRTCFGDPAAALGATLHVEDPRFYRELVMRGALGGAEAYMDGAWHSDDVAAVVRVLARNRKTLARINGGLARLATPLLALAHSLRRNTRPGSRRNIEAHYDLGNEFFELFLDPTLTYSCGLFEHAAATMEQASLAKYDRICRKLSLGPGDHVLEIGSGWGGFAIHAATHYGCRVTTTTISRHQLERARQRVVECGLEDRIEVLFDDYRDLRGRYDKLVSIEMIEAVGHAQLEGFFRVCGERVRPGGAMLLQAITVADQDLDESLRSVDFIKRYIFPGGQLVSLGSMIGAAARASGLRAIHVEDLTPHYAETLRRWQRRMAENLPRMRALGLSERFLRMWDFYLRYCEGGFEERQIGLVQMVFEQPDARGLSLGGAPA